MAISPSAKLFGATFSCNRRRRTSARQALTPPISPTWSILSPAGPDFAEEDAHYEAENFEADIVLPERTRAMASDLFGHMLATGGPHQKTIVFCVRDFHADQVASAMNDLYADWRQAQGLLAGVRAEPYAFKCTAESGGAAMIADFKGAEHSFFIAATVDLLSTGVDVPEVRNVVFFRYVSSPIAFYQMVGRGTRLTAEKLMFRIYDYTDASRLFGAAFLAKARSVSEPEPVEVDDDDEAAPGLLQGDGVTVRIIGAGRYVLDFRRRRRTADHDRGLSRPHRRAACRGGADIADVP